MSTLFAGDLLPLLTAFTVLVPFWMEAKPSGRKCGLCRSKTVRKSSTMRTSVLATALHSINRLNRIVSAANNS